MIFHKLFIKHTSGAIRKVRLKFDTKKSLDELRECVEFPASWGITSVAYLYAPRRK